MIHPKSIEGPFHRLIRKSAERRAFLWICLSLSLAGTVLAIYPITFVVITAVLVAPERWRRITAFTSLGSALGATILVVAFHSFGWSYLYEQFPELVTHPTWARVMTWAQDYDAMALLLISVAPLPQTPALIVFSVAPHNYLIVFFSILVGKSLKYGVVAWLISRFPERYEPVSYDSPTPESGDRANQRSEYWH